MARMSYREGRFWQPDVTVATVVVRDGRVLCVEERVNGNVVIENPSEEYERIYEHFARLLKKGKSDVSDAPLRLVADAFLLGARQNVEDFSW